MGNFLTQNDFNIGKVDSTLEGSKKATRGGEWEPIKISYRNLVYIPNRTRRSCLLTRPGPHSH
jgi:hypothetical protein